jgi:multiple sugar transport system substrate-binding protein
VSTVHVSRRSLLRGSLVAGGGALLAACGATPAPAATAAPAATVAPTTVAAAATVAPTTAPAAATEAPAAVPTVAPTAAAATPAAASSVLQLEVWNADWGEEFNAPMKTLSDKYQQANPNVKINWQFSLGCGGQGSEKMATAVAGGIPPDAAYTCFVDLPTQMSQGLYLPLDDYFSAAGIKQSDFVKAMMDACLYNGKTYAIPGGSDTHGIIYNKQVYKDAGLDPEKPPVTLAEWVEHSKKIYQTDSSGNVTRLGMNPGGEGIVHTGFLYKAMYYDFQNKKVTCNSDQAVEALTWMVDTAKLFPPEKVASFSQGMPGYSQPNSGFSTNKEAYIVTGFWAGPPLKKYSPDVDYGMGYVPTVGGTDAERELYALHGWNYSIPKGAKQRDEAWKFMKFAFWDEAVFMAVNTWNPICIISKLDEFEKECVKTVLADTPLAKYFNIYTETSKRAARGWPVMPVASQYWDEIYRAADFAMRGEKTPKAALDECATRIQDALDKALQSAGA